MYCQYDPMPEMYSFLILLKVNEIFPLFIFPVSEINFKRLEANTRTKDRVVQECSRDA